MMVEKGRINPGHHLDSTKNSYTSLASIKGESYKGNRITYLHTEFDSLRKYRPTYAMESSPRTRVVKGLEWNREEHGTSSVVQS
jgi:hypothetical protein